MANNNYLPQYASPADILLLHGVVENRLRSDESIFTDADPRLHYAYIELIPVNGLRRLGVKYSSSNAMIKQETDISDGQYLSEIYHISNKYGEVPKIARNTEHIDINASKETISLDDLLFQLYLEESMPVTRVACHALITNIRESRVHPIQPDPSDC